MKRTIEDYLFLKENFLDNEYCEKSISELEICKWIKHERYTPKKSLPVFQNLTDELEEVGEIVQAGIIGSDLQEKAEDINELIVKKVSLTIQEYIKKLNFFWFDGWAGYSPIKFIRYLPGQEMKVHCDHIHSMFDGIRKGVPILSIIGYLNDDYEGGETYFFEDEKVDTKQGDLLIFPSNFLYPHYVTPVTKGVRYSYVSWVW